MANRIFSKPFLQNQMIATAKNISTGVVINYHILYKNGVFLVIQNFPNEMTVIPTGGREVLAQHKNNPAYTYTYLNGFTEEDALKMATLQQSKDAFGLLDSQLWFAFTLTKEDVNAITGFIEPYAVDNTPELEALSIKAVKYSIELSKLLQKSGILHPSFNEFSAI